MSDDGEGIRNRVGSRRISCRDAEFGFRAEYASESSGVWVLHGWSLEIVAGGDGFNLARLGRAHR